jgi:hypothetical protein
LNTDYIFYNKVIIFPNFIPYKIKNFLFYVIIAFNPHSTKTYKKMTIFFQVINNEDPKKI